MMLMGLKIPCSQGRTGSSPVFGKPLQVNDLQGTFQTTESALFFVTGTVFASSLGQR